MPTWLLYGFAALAIVAAVSGGYIWLDRTLVAKDKQISTLQISLDAAKSDLIEAKNTIKSKELEIDRIRTDLVESQAQADRIRQKDLIEREKQIEFDRKIQNLDTRNPQTLDAINKYQECVARNPGDTTCANLLP